jgi:enoyl-CoA hydratase/carnithine racemase
VADFETIEYRSDEAVAWVTLNRPEVHNAFNATMQRELKTVWRWLRRDDSVRAVILTGSGEKAFCTGIDRGEVMGTSKETNLSARRNSGDGPDPAAGEPPIHVGSGSTPFMFDDPGENIGPKSNDLWKPVVAAVNGMACGGAFYMLGEVDFIIASETATFFDPHVSYGMTAGYEPLQLLPKMPFQEILRLSLLGNSERMSASRAHQVGFVSEICPPAELHDRALWAATEIAKAPPLAIQGTLRALWAGRELSRGQSLGLAWAFVGLGTDQDSLAEGQRTFSSGVRTTPRIR